jgi:hypothetical protein
MDIKEIVKDNEVHFAKYRQGFAYYAVRVPSEGIDYMFPVPLSDIGDATLLATDRAMVFMRYTIGGRIFFAGWIREGELLLSASSRPD